MPARRVLCVEDDEDTRVLLKTLLSFSDFEAIVAPDADAALHLMKRERFSLYVLDGGWPGVSGPSLCERIRAADAHTPIVIFSGQAFASDIKAGMRAGANAYIVKPELSKLVPTIKNLLEAVSA
jgi:DNA-binding response OmpR family regulator